MIPATTISYYTKVTQVSSGLAANANRRTDMFFGGAGQADVRSAFLLCFLGDILEWAQVNLAGTQQLTTIAQYAYWLCGGYAPMAAAIISGGATGIPIVPGTGSVSLISYQNDYVVGDVDSPILAGANQYTINIGKGRAWSSASVSISKDQVELPQNKVSYDSYLASYDTTTGLVTITFNFNVQNSQLFIVMFNYLII